MVDEMSSELAEKLKKFQIIKRIFFSFPIALIIYLLVLLGGDIVKFERGEIDITKNKCYGPEIDKIAREKAKIELPKHMEKDKGAEWTKNENLKQYYFDGMINDLKQFDKGIIEQAKKECISVANARNMKAAFWFFIIGSLIIWGFYYIVRFFYIGKFKIK